MDDNIVFYRITPGFCIDGCEYGRKFMKKINLSKAHVQSENSMDFYKVFEEDKTLHKKKPEIENDVSYYKKEKEE